MGEPVMELGDRELEKIGQYVQSHLDEWNKSTMLNFQSSREIDIRERIVRVEESLKNQIELTKQGFDMMEKRFEQVDKRFEQVEKRFEQVDKRFEQVDKRFEIMQHNFDKRFSQLQWTMGLGFTVLAALMGVFNFF